MTTYVLVYGAWDGSWGWRKFDRNSGLPVMTYSCLLLRGLDERFHLAAPQVNLSTHAQDVVNTIEYEDLTDIVLVGYCYRGMVVTGESTVSAIA